MKIQVENDGTMDEMKDRENKIWESWNLNKDEGRNESDKFYESPIRQLKKWKLKKDRV